MGTMMERTIWVGFDKREVASFAVTCHSVRRRLTLRIPVRGLVLDNLKRDGLYHRESELRRINDTLVTWDLISDAPQSTEHANARFLTPFLAESGWALFMDGDMLALDDVSMVFEGLDPAKAVYCVKHRQVPDYQVKMDGQVQTVYARKNWSSFVIFNKSHAANKALTVEMINTLPGRDLHRFCWLTDDLIGELDPSWNYLVGHTQGVTKPRVVHFTDGTPDMHGYEASEYAGEWREELGLWAD